MREAVEERPFELCIMRHGIAVEPGSQPGLRDANRALTPEGRERIRKIARGLEAIGFIPEWIVSSPYVRAAETAKLVAESLTNVPLDYCAALEPGGSRKAVLAFLASNPKPRQVLLVGHETDVSELAGYLTGAGPTANLSMKKGGCCLIAFYGTPLRVPGLLRWWLTPRILSRLI